MRARNESHIAGRQRRHCESGPTSGPQMPRDEGSLEAPENLERESVFGVEFAPAAADFAVSRYPYLVAKSFSLRPSLTRTGNHIRRVCASRQGWNPRKTRRCGLCGIGLDAIFHGEGFSAVLGSCVPRGLSGSFPRVSFRNGDSRLRQGVDILMIQTSNPLGNRVGALCQQRLLGVTSTPVGPSPWTGLSKTFRLRASAPQGHPATVAQIMLNRPYRRAALFGH